jgi:hypothetical protein
MFPTQVPLNVKFYLIKICLGARGFAADVTIWDSALTTHQVDRIYRPLWSNSPLIRPLVVALEFLSFLTDSPKKQTEKEKDPLASDHNLEPEYQEEFQELVELRSQSEFCSQQSDCQLRSWYDLLSPSPESTTTDSDYQHLLLEIENAVTNCKPPATRLDLYAEASVLGHIESLYKWSMLIGFGSEIPSNTCGIEEFLSFPQQYHQVVFTKEEKECSYLSDEMISDQVKAVVGLMIAAQAGHSSAYIPLSTFISSSIGLGIFSLDFRSSHGQCVLKKIVQSIPLPSSFPSPKGDRQGSPNLTSLSFLIF